MKDTMNPTRKTRIAMLVVALLAPLGALADDAHHQLAATTAAVVHSWVDRETHRFGIVTYDPVTGRRLDSIELGATGGWYDREHVELALDGPREVVVSAMFAVA